MLLSFSSEWLPYLIRGEKKFEHRKRFYKEDVIAYIYIGAPMRKIVAKIELGKREELKDWVNKYSYDNEAIKRINDFMTRNKYVMPVKWVQRIEPIDIREIEKEIEGFRVPISYMFLDDKVELFEAIESRVKNVGDCLINDFSNIKSTDVCRC